MRASSRDAGETVATQEDRPITEEFGMYAATVRFMIRRCLRALTAGDMRPLQSSYGDDAVHVLPARSSWAAS